MLPIHSTTHHVRCEASTLVCFVSSVVYRLLHDQTPTNVRVSTNRAGTSVKTPSLVRCSFIRERLNERMNECMHERSCNEGKATLPGMEAWDGEGDPHAAVQAAVDAHLDPALLR